ncbi:MAG: sigma-70 family RNA polymerase sigma factor [Verrucomicrobiales bacterium]|nr:sigma-70 family RNA polymerase sigma factor [Verrucomicrobiales bacterium]
MGTQDESTPESSITLDDLRNLVGELRMVAARLLSCESRPHTYTPTALFMSAIRRVKLKDQDWEGMQWANRAHFFSALSLAMRNALVDHARRRRARGRDQLVYLPPDEGVFLDLPAEAESRPERVLVLEEALDRLEAGDPRLSEVVRQHYYFGYSVPEMARFLGVSEKTVDRDLNKARVLLRKLIAEAGLNGAP